VAHSALKNVTHLTLNSNYIHRSIAKPLHSTTKAILLFYGLENKA